MTQTKAQFTLQRINELVDKVIECESIPKESFSYDDLQWIKFYAKDLVSKCEGCNDTPPTGSQNENKE